MADSSDSTVAGRVRSAFMAPVDRIAHAESERYRKTRAEIGVVFPMSLKAKMLVTVGSLLISVLAAPAAWVRRDSIRELEFPQGTVSTAETLSLFSGVVILIGILNTFFVGVYMLKYVWERADDPSPTEDEIRKQLRVEDFVFWFQIWGTLAILAPLIFLVAAALIPGGPDLLYDAGVTLYRPISHTVFDMRIVAATGGLSGLVLAALWWLARR